MERFEQLTPTLGYHYDDASQSPTTDSFLLAAFPKLKPGLRVCDLGAGSGLLGLLLLARQEKLHVTGLELQARAVDLAKRNLCTVQQGDLRDIKTYFPTGAFDLMVSNPPYFTPESGFCAPRSQRANARSETTCTLDDVFQAAKYGLRWGGHFCLVHRPERLTDVLTCGRTHQLEPKRLRFVCTQAHRPPCLFLLECRRGGKPDLQILPPLILQQPDGTPTPEVDAIYFNVH